jgi:DNA-binding transcriptional ArsR family regulator
MPSINHPKSSPMAFSKNNLYPQELQLISHFARAFSYSGRLEILLKLQMEGPLTVDTIRIGHPISKETMSGHLKILRENHLIIPDERYPFTFYENHEINLERAEEAFNGFFSLLRNQR